MNRKYYNLPNQHTRWSMDSGDHIFQCSGYIENNAYFEGFSKAYTRNISFKDHNFLAKIKMNLLLILAFMNFVFEYYLTFIRMHLRIKALLLLLIIHFNFLDNLDSFLITWYSKECIQKRKQSVNIQEDQYFSIKNLCYYIYIF